MKRLRQTRRSRRFLRPFLQLSENAVDKNAQSVRQIGKNILAEHALSDLQYLVDIHTCIHDIIVFIYNHKKRRNLEKGLFQNFFNSDSPLAAFFPDTVIVHEIISVVAVKPYTGHGAAVWHLLFLINLIFTALGQKYVAHPPDGLAVAHKQIAALIQGIVEPLEKPLLDRRL